MPKPRVNESAAWVTLLERCRIGELVGSALIAVNLVLVIVAAVVGDLVVVGLAAAASATHGVVTQGKRGELTALSLHGAITAVVAVVAVVAGASAASFWLAAAVLVGFIFPWRALAWALTVLLTGVTIVAAGLGVPLVWTLAPAIFGQALATFGDRLIVGVNREIEARRQAEAASLANEEFLSTISHEIRTPMSGILGVADLLLERQLAAAVREPVEVMRRSAESIMRIVEDILDFSRISAVGLTLSTGPFDLRTVIHDVAALHRARAEARGLCLGVQIATGVPRRIDSDAGRIRQVVTNLLSNAVKFTERGSIELVVDGRVIGDVCWTRIRVTDTGIGIPSAIQRRIFDAFIQAENAVTRRSGGTGLGLTITRRLVHALGGTIDVLSAVGKGTTFVVEVPLRVAVDMPAPESRPSAPEPRRVARILVVDDDEINRDVACAHLESMGHQVDGASGGFEALRRLQEATYDLVLIDCQMPDLDGYETTRHLRSIEGERRRTPVLALTASASASVRERCIAAGMDGHLSKPIRRAMLKDAIEPWVAVAVDPTRTPR